jgi:hypothetical protein
MVFAGIDYLAVAIATFVGFAVSLAWYRVFALQWAAALGKTGTDTEPRPRPFLMALAGQLLMAYMLAGAIGHLGAVTLHNGVVTAAFIWLGFVATTIAINHGLQGRSLSLTLIDAGHWLAVLVLMGGVIGMFGV